MMKIKIKLLYDDSKLPIKGSEQAACYDVYAHSINSFADNKIEVGLGFSTEIPDGYKGIIVPRSNLTKHYWVMNNNLGVVDADFRAEWIVRFTNINPQEIQSFPYRVGERIAQIYFEKVLPFEFEEVSELNETTRGDGAFGSTGLI